MPPKKRPTVEDDESDSDNWVKVQAQMQKLKTDREKKLNDVVKKSHTEFQKLLTEVEEKRERERQHGVKEQARHITTLIDSMERRGQIEKEMQDIVTEAQGRMEEVEHVMFGGYEGRLEAMNRVLDKAEK